MRQELTQARLKELLNYDPETGKFTWKVKKGRRVPGDKAGTPHNEGYVSLKLDGVTYLRHRCAWLYTHGVWPKNQLDHRNGTRGDDRLSNLRECTMGENNQNKVALVGSSSGFLGVTWDKRGGRWKAQIKYRGAHSNLGEFDTPEEAHQSYLTAKAQLHTFQPTPRITTT